MTGQEAFRQGAIAAEKLAREWAWEAQKATDEAWKNRCLEQAKVADERSIWYNNRIGEPT